MAKKEKEIKEIVEIENLDDDDELTHILSTLEGEGYKIQLYKYYPDGSIKRIGTYPASIDIDEIARKTGGGKYLLRIVNPSGKFVRNLTIEWDTSIANLQEQKEKTDNTTELIKKTEALEQKILETQKKEQDSIKELITAILQGQQQTLNTFITTLASIMGQKANNQLEIEKLLQIMTYFRQMGFEPSQITNTIMDTLKRGIETGLEIGEKKAEAVGNNEMLMVAEIIKEILKNRPEPKKQEKQEKQDIKQLTQDMHGENNKMKMGLLQQIIKELERLYQSNLSTDEVAEQVLALTPPAFYLPFYQLLTSQDFDKKAEQVYKFTDEKRAWFNEVKNKVIEKMNNIINESNQV